MYCLSLCLVTLETEKLEMVSQDSGDQPTTLIKNEQQQQQQCSAVKNIN